MGRATSALAGVNPPQPGQRFPFCRRSYVKGHRDHRRAEGYGRLLVREMRANSAWRMNPIGFIDDDPLKAHRWIVGVPVHGAIDQLEQVMRVYKVDEVLLSSPAINGNVEGRIREVSNGR